MPRNQPWVVKPEDYDSFLFWKVFYKDLRRDPAEFAGYVLIAGGVLLYFWGLVCVLALFV
jgi:hypothetical protein